MPRTEALASWLTRSRVEKPKVSQLADYETPSKAVFISMVHQLFVSHLERDL